MTYEIPSSGLDISPQELEAIREALGGGPAEPEEEKLVVPDYTIGGDNTVYWENVEFNPASIIKNLQSQIFAGLSVRGFQNGWTADTVKQIMEGHWDELGGFLDFVWGEADQTRSKWLGVVDRFGDANGFTWREGDLKQQMGAHYYTQTQEGFMELTQRVWDFYNQRTSVDLGEYPTGDITGGSRRGGGGRSGPTEADIRGQFDLDELAEVAANIWRGMLLTDDADTRGMAKAYVDAIVSSKGKKHIDFTEFVRGRAKQTDRYASIYRNKPDSLAEEQYLAPYFQSAMRVVRPGEADEIAIGGAQFGASSEAFAARLRRSEAATSSAPFINELQDRLSDLNRLFKG